MTAGNRVMWNKNRNPPNVVFIDKEHDLHYPPDIIADNRYLPIRLDLKIDSIIFDPPWGINLPPWFLNKKPIKTKSTWGKTRSYFGDFKSKRELLSYIHKAQEEFQKYNLLRLCFKWGERNVSLWNILPFFKQGWIEVHRVYCPRAQSFSGDGKSKTDTWWVVFNKNHSSLRKITGEKDEGV